MTLKEMLTEKADAFEKNIDVKCEMRIVEKDLQRYYNMREYTINLLVPKQKLNLTDSDRNYRSFIVPGKVDPIHYRDLFVEELNKLGFTNKFIECLRRDEYSNCDSYKIVVRW